MKKFKQGDVVKLNSGGPNMTVKSYDRIMNLKENKESDTIVICNWFEGTTNKIGKFDQESLELVKK